MSTHQNNGQNGSNCRDKQIIVVMVPLPAQGHLNQLLHLSRLISSHNIPVYYLGTATHNRQAKTRIHGWDPIAISNIHFHDCPTPSFQKPPPNPNAPTKFPSHLIPTFFATLELRQPIYQLILELAVNTPRIIVIYDSLMPYVIQDVVPSIPNAESYCFHSTSAFTIYSFLWEAIGKPDVPEAELFKQVLLPPRESSFPQKMAEYAQLQTESRKVNSGNIFNSCREIEGSYLDVLAKFRLSDTDKYWALGPFNPVFIPEEKNQQGKRHKCLEWLDKQAPNSVIFVSFGTTTSLSDEEIKELAIGLEKSEQNFIWVVRDADKGDIFEGEEVRRAQLPEGYEKRIEGRGLIVRDWAPQLEILGHISTGGFMSHCGWNSTMESISMGVPIAAWPMHSDQPRNAILITQLLKIGVNVRDWSRGDEVVRSKTIENAVRRLMDSSEGEEMRNRVVKLSDAVKKSMADGREMDSFIVHICR
ncbi:hypothetical protein M9H77_04066 [Catharanthus roseus]|uniref:Uncharacterized protein n=1 Tax=Catharanthus roseus TaxID=4058 RepID=A0ACC0CCY7_CATRO|nr:hypothetical protein M9H77_04066 [Catharanthus roseus]